MRPIRLAISLMVIAAAMAAPAPSAAQHTGGAPDGGPALGPVPSTDVIGHLRTWTGKPSRIGGTSCYSQDEFILTDLPFDDRGADIDLDDGRVDDNEVYIDRDDPVSKNPFEYYSMTHGAQAATSSAGDYVYPDDPALRNNAADIVELRIFADEVAWFLLVRLNTMIDPERVAIGGSVRGDFRFPDDEEPVPLLIHGQKGSVGGQPIEVVADAEMNTIEARIPRAVYDPGEDSFRILIGAGLWDVAKDSWLVPPRSTTGDRQRHDEPLPYYDLAIRTFGFDRSYWGDVEQAEQLANPEKAWNRVSVGELPEWQNDCEDRPSTADWSTNVFESSQEVGEGVELQTSHGQDEGGLGYKYYRSKTQPYALYAPFNPSHKPRPLVLLLHFLGGNHNSFGITAKKGIEYWAEDLGVMVAMPFARGEAGWYEGPAEKDVFEVWRDIAGRFAIDRDRVYIAGMSMGGFGAWRLGGLYPDQFARAMVWSGPITPNAIWPSPAPVMWPQPNPPMCDRDEQGCGYSLRDLFPNMGHLPYLVVHGGADELVPITGPVGWMREFDGGPYRASPFRFVVYPARRHETSFPGTTHQLVRDWLWELPTREVNPESVRYTIVRDLLDEEHGLTYDGAYWVSDMTLQPGVEEGYIQADKIHEDDEDDNKRFWKTGPVTGVDSAGPYVLTEEKVSYHSDDDAYLNIFLRGLQTAAIDTTRLGWAGSGYLDVSVGETQPTLTLFGAFTADTTVEGAPYTAAGGVITLHLPPGSSGIKIST